MNEENQKLLPAYTGAGDAELSSQYVALFRRFNPNIPADYPDKKCLWLFRKWARRMIGVFNLLDRPMINDLIMMQKACMSYMLEADIPRETRIEVAKSCEMWFDLVMLIDRKKPFTSRSRQSFHKLIKDIEKLRGESTETQG